MASHPRTGAVVKLQRLLAQHELAAEPHIRAAASIRHTLELLGQADTVTKQESISGVLAAAVAMDTARVARRTGLVDRLPKRRGRLPKRTADDAGDGGFKTQQQLRRERSLAVLQQLSQTEPRPKEHLTAHGINPARMAVLIQHGYIKKTKAGEYLLTDAGANFAVYK